MNPTVIHAQREADVVGDPHPDAKPGVVHLNVIRIAEAVLELAAPIAEVVALVKAVNALHSPPVEVDREDGAATELAGVDVLASVDDPAALLRTGDPRLARGRAELRQIRVRPDACLLLLRPVALAALLLSAQRILPLLLLLLFELQLTLLVVAGVLSSGHGLAARQLGLSQVGILLERCADPATVRGALRATTATERGRQQGGNRCNLRRS